MLAAQITLIEKIFQLQTWLSKKYEELFSEGPLEHLDALRCCVAAQGLAMRLFDVQQTFRVIKTFLSELCIKIVKN